MAGRWLARSWLAFLFVRSIARSLGFGASQRKRERCLNKMIEIEKNVFPVFSRAHILFTCMHPTESAVPRSRPDVESLERRRESSSLAPGLRSQSHDCLVWLQSTSGSPRSRESRHFVVGNGHGP